jgi:hypothetical protein
MPKINNKNIKIANFLKRKKQNNEEQIIYRTSDSLSIESNISKTNDSSNSIDNTKNSNSKTNDISNSIDNTKSSNSKKESDNKSSSINSFSCETQTIKSKSPILRSLKKDTDTDFNNWDIDVISSKINKLSSIDGCSETSECNTDKSSIKSKKGDFTSTNSNSNFNWDFMEKKSNNTITIEKNNISITIDESNNIKIKFM